MKKCSCGNDRNSKGVVHKTHYSAAGWLLLSLIGMSAKPVKVEFTCTKCGKTFESSVDPAVLKMFTGR